MKQIKYLLLCSLMAASCFSLASGRGKRISKSEKLLKQQFPKVYRALPAKELTGPSDRFFLNRPDLKPYLVDYYEQHCEKPFTVLLDGELQYIGVTQDNEGRFYAYYAQEDFVQKKRRVRRNTSAAKKKKATKPKKKKAKKAKAPKSQGRPACLKTFFEASLDDEVASPSLKGDLVTSMLLSNFFPASNTMSYEKFRAKLVEKDYLRAFVNLCNFDGSAGQWFNYLGINSLLLLNFSQSKNKYRLVFDKKHVMLVKVHGDLKHYGPFVSYRAVF